MKNRRKHEFPLTVFLIGIVIILSVILAVVVGKFLDISSEEYEQYQKESLLALEEEQQMTRQDQTESEMQTETNRLEQSEEEPETGMIDITIDQESETEPFGETETEPLVVAIDPGHQGSWVDMSDTEPNGPGSSVMKRKATVGTQGSFSGKTEYELNLEVSLLLQNELEYRGYQVILTREDHDTAISNAERALLAYEQGADIYVRIHANGADDSSIDGALAMVPSSQNPYVGALAADSYLLGQCILDAYCSKASFDSLGIQYYDDMTGINWSRVPVMILEMGFMTNESDDLRMADPEIQTAMAEGIADGVDAYFEQKGMKQKHVSAEDQEKVHTALEILGETYVYPASLNGETWAVSIKNLNTGAAGDLNGEKQMKAASLMKVFIMGAIYDRVCYPSSPERYISYPEAYEGELKQLITDMITVSDNTAANTLVTTLGGGDPAAGMAVVNQFCKEQGYEQTSMGRLFLEENPSGDNYTSANDCRMILEQISSGTCVNAEASAKMLDYLKQQTKQGKIPAGLQEAGVSVANKTGELAGDYGVHVEHDIAVIEKDGSAVVLCFLSEGVQDHGAAITQITNMAQDAYRELQ